MYELNNSINGFNLVNEIKKVVSRYFNVCKLIKILNITIILISQVWKQISHFNLTSININPDRTTMVKLYAISTLFSLKGSRSFITR